MEDRLLDSTANNSNTVKALHLVNTVSSPNTVLPQVSNRNTDNSHSTELLKADEEGRLQASTEPHPSKVDILAVPRRRVILLRADAVTLKVRRLLDVTRCDNGSVDLGRRTLALL
jgi:hypothetical protein